ncbi:MAG TPA: alpha/beta hydrolase [Chitinophagaceae bacterium]
MRKIIHLVLCIMLAQTSLGQTVEGYFRKADSLYKQKDFRNAAIAFSEAFNASGKTQTGLYRSATASWALANVPDSAFKLLNQLAASDRISKFDLYQIENGPDYISLQKDNRWKPALDKIRKQVEKNSFQQEEFIYGRKDGVALTLVQVKPKVKPIGKAIIFVVSGGWVSGYNGIEVFTDPVLQYLTRGYTVFAVVHGSQPRFAIPDAASDIKRAVRYIRYNAAKFGIDPNKIGITGGSAGGHLSLTVATSDDKPNPTAIDPIERVSSRVQAVAVLYPPTDFLNWGGPGMNMANAKAALIERRSWGAVDFKVWNERLRLYEEVSDTAARNRIAKEFSPVYAVSPDDPPVFIIHGDADPTVPLQQSQSIIARLNEAGVPNRLIIKKGGKHNSEQMKPEWLEFVDWFDKYLK